MVLKAIKARIYPNQTQRKQLLVNFGCVRFVWNQMLNMQIERHKNNKDAKYQNHFAMNNMLKAMKLERSEEHTSELQSRFDIVCRLLLENKNKKKQNNNNKS